MVTVWVSTAAAKPAAKTAAKMASFIVASIELESQAFEEASRLYKKISKSRGSMTFCGFS